MHELVASEPSVTTRDRYDSDNSRALRSHLHFHDRTFMASVLPAGLVASWQHFLYQVSLVV